MSIPYLVRKKVSVIGGNKKVRWYAVQKKLQERGGKTEEDVARIVAERAGFREGEVQGILTDVSLVLGELLAEGYSRIQVAEQLDMTEANVKYHMAQAYKKLGVKDKAGAVLEAKNRQLI